MATSARLAAVQRDLLRWYRRSGRDLPWRRTRDPYRILISEVMLQQTQVHRVATHYRRFLKQFPNLRILASASPGTVLRAWRGLGYNMRGLRLRELAIVVRDECRGRFPRTVDELERLPGIGPYTARAVACFAFGASVPVLDTNVRRVFLRLFSRDSQSDDLWDLTEKVLPKRSAYDWNQALMDLGSTICTATSPDCERCPIGRHCPSVGRARRDPSPKTSGEKLFRGHPRRIHRGRIVTYLARMGRGRATSLKVLGRHVLPPFSSRDELFLRKTLTTLERDGMVKIERRGPAWNVSLVS